MPARDGYQRLLAIWLGLFCAGFCVLPGEWPQRALFYASVPLTLPAAATTLYRIWTAPLSWALAAFLVYGGVSALWSDHWRSVGPAVGQAFWIGYLLVTCCAIGGTPATLRSMLLGVAAFASVWAVVAVADFAATCTDCSRFVGFGRHANANYTASVAGTIAVLGLAAVFSTQVRGRWWWLLCQPPLLALLMAAGGRAAMLGYGGSIVLGTALLTLRTGFARAALVVAATAGGIGAAALATAWLAGGWLAAEIGRGDTYRVQIWQGNLDRVLQRPWFGHGSTAQDQFAVNGRVIGFHAHNLFLAQAFYGGVIGLALWVAVVVLAARASVAAWRATGDLVPVSGLFFLLAVGMVDIGYVIVDVQAIWLYVWVVLGIVLAYDVAARRPTDAARPVPRRVRTAS